MLERKVVIEIEQFSYRAPQAALDDLMQRLARTRWPERETAEDCSQGVPLSKLKELAELRQEPVR